MPIYAYKCESCGHQQDVLQKISEPVLTQCPDCGAETFKKQLTAAGFQLKGSGWYATDFRGGSSGASAKSSGADSKASESTPSSAGASSTGSSGEAATGCGGSCACH